MPSIEKDQVQATWEAAGQGHLFQHLDRLNGAQRAEFLEQLASIDLGLIRRLYESAAKSQGTPPTHEHAPEAPPAVTLADLADPDLRAEARAAGEEALRAGKVGMIMVAGGQGSRLGFDQPKGMFPIGPLSNRTLFEVMTDVLKARSRYYGQPIPLYLMTSPATDADTKKELKQKQDFGLGEGNLQVFCQGTMPAVDAATGHLLLDTPGELFLSPDGHGGMLQAFQESGCLADAMERGLEYLFYCQVDNPLAQICDPVLIGLHRLRQSQATTQVVRKLHPTQKVGNVVQVGHRLQVIEYSDLPLSMAEQRGSDGELKFWAGSIAIHVFSLEFLREATRQTLDEGAGLPFHIAKKKVPFVNEAGERIEPKEENAFKFERFIFDLLPMAERAIVVEVDPAEGFAAVKNAAGAASETAATTQAAMIAQHTRWLQAAGVDVAPGVKVEIHPELGWDAESVARLGDRLPAAITEDTYLSR